MNSPNYQRRVSYTTAPPVVYLTASNLLSWQNGEVDFEPLMAAIINAKILTKQALAAATKQLEEEKKTMEYPCASNATPGQATGMAHVPARRPAVSFAPTLKREPDTSMAPPQLQRTRVIRRKEVPLRLVRSGNDALSRSAPAQEMLRPVTSEVTTHRFEDFVLSERICNSQAENPENTRRFASSLFPFASNAFKKTADKAMKAAVRFGNAVDDFRANSAKRQNG
jgi:hypothetical protein